MEPFWAMYAFHKTDKVSLNFLSTGFVVDLLSLRLGQIYQDSDLVNNKNLDFGYSQTKTFNVKENINTSLLGKCLFSTPRISERNMLQL